MSNLVKKPALELISFDQEKLDLIKQTIAKDLDNGQFALFIEYAKSKGLDPIQRQVHAVTRIDSKTQKRVMTIQTGIDGFRLIASRSDAYAGRDEALFEYGKGGKPIKCKITVYKIVSGQRCPFTATAKWDEYYPGDKMGFMWNKMPETMLEKCAEAKALRMAFPADLAGLHVNEEMHQADYEPIREVSQTSKEIESTANIQHEKIVRAFSSLNITKDQICEALEVDDLSELNEAQLDYLRGCHSRIKNGEMSVEEFISGGLSDQ